MRRAVGLVVLGVVLAVTCTFLGRWQWHRHEWRDAQIAVAEANYDAEPVPFADVVAGPSDPLADDEQWLPVTLVGTYQPEATVLLRNRPVEGQAVYHVLVPFQVDGPDGALFVVDRGWVPTGEDATTTVPVPAPPTGEVTLVARLRPAESGSTRTAEGYAQSIDPAQVVASGGLDASGNAVYTGVYGQRVSEDPAPTSVPGDLPTPDLDPGSHLSYAFQWWVFALGSLIGFSWLARRELVDEREELEEASASPNRDEGEPRERSVARPRRREGRAEAEEDALIDAQLADRPGPES
ncbi:hypothetical protein CCO02nite_00340 [Cellulomonas composti]|uniref:SURF1-like protein n=1 Tax=Cellulomonas composti TaxID=266130 RepID=A0A511J5V2_9CELL|nr:hypothetical protein CCO02nite_00340 [Cellulomonas composti]